MTLATDKIRVLNQSIDLPLDAPGLPTTFVKKRFPAFLRKDAIGGKLKVCVATRTPMLQ
jgi:hypothetical protein